MLAVLFCSGSAKESDPHHKMAAFVAQELQKLRRPGHVVYGGGIELIGEVIHAAAKGGPGLKRPPRRRYSREGGSEEVHRLRIRRLESRIDSMSR
jgi:hypothetical protein